jgi:hypothetical protein
LKHWARNRQGRLPCSLICSSIGIRSFFCNFWLLQFG